MEPKLENAKLENIRPDKIQPNPDNPRLMFRQTELDELQESIRVLGIQVPIAVYKDGSNYILIDGERRWRCAKKLNLPTIPALVQKKPSALQNLLLMFNIHALREQWDLLTIAIKLPSVIDMLRTELGKEPTEADISLKTGLNRGVIRRCKYLINLPDKYKDMLLKELHKPKSKQRLSEDLFIEMERTLKTVVNALPEAIPNVDKARDVLLKKYQSEVIKNIVDLRKVAKIARGEKAVGADRKSAVAAIKRLISDPLYTIDQAFNETVSDLYTEHDLVSRIEALLGRLTSAPEEAIDQDVREKLQQLVDQAQKLLDREDQE